MKSRCMDSARKKRRVTRPSVREDGRFLFSSHAGQVRCCCAESCLASECVAQVFANRCGLDMRSVKDRKIICQFCNIYHAGYDAGFDAGYDYVIIAARRAGQVKQL